MANRCPKCGNTYESWSHGICYVCVRNERDAKRFGRRYQSSTEKYGRGLAGHGKKGDASRAKNKKIRPKRNEKIQPQQTQYPSRELVIGRLNAMNALLRDIYSREYRLSQILIAQDTSKTQVEAWGANIGWLAKYLDTLVDALCRLLRSELSDHDPSIIVRIYGLTSGQGASHKSISGEIGISEDEIKSSSMQSIEVLRTKGVQSRLERIVVESANAAS